MSLTNNCTRTLLIAGLDYTVAHYGIITRDPRLDCVLTFVDDRAEADAADWGVGEVSGARDCAKPLYTKPHVQCTPCVVQQHRRGYVQDYIHRHPQPISTANQFNCQVGGFEAYLLADEDKEGAAAADTYRQVRARAAAACAALTWPAATSCLRLSFLQQPLSWQLFEFATRLTMCRTRATTLA